MQINSRAQEHFSYQDYSPAERIDGVEISPAVFALVDHFASDGPVRSGSERAPYLRDQRTQTHLTDGRRYLARAPEGALDLITMEPLWLTAFLNRAC